MKKILLASLTAVFILSGCASYQMNNASVYEDDLYYNPSDKPLAIAENYSSLPAPDKEIKKQDNRTYSQLKNAYQQSAASKEQEDLRDFSSIQNEYTDLLTDNSVEEVDTMLYYNDETGYWVNDYTGSEMDRNYAERLAKFHGSFVGIPYWSPLYNEVIFGSGFDYNVYIEGDYAIVIPEWYSPYYNTWRYARPYNYYGGWHGSFGWNYPYSSLGWSLGFGYNWYSPYYYNWGYPYYNNYHHHAYPYHGHYSNVYNPSKSLRPTYSTSNSNTIQRSTRGSDLKSSSTSTPARSTRASYNRTSGSTTTKATQTGTRTRTSTRSNYTPTYTRTSTSSSSSRSTYNRSSRSGSSNTSTSSAKSSSYSNTKRNNNTYSTGSARTNRSNYNRSSSSTSTRAYTPSYNRSSSSGSSYSGTSTRSSGSRSSSGSSSRSSGSNRSGGRR